MNKFTQHIPNYIDTDYRKEFEFESLTELCSKLGRGCADLAYDGDCRDGYYLMTVSKDETLWRVLGRTTNKVEGLEEWKGPRYSIIEVESVHGWGLDKYQPKEVGDFFEVRRDSIEWYSSFRGKLIGELKDGRCFIGQII